VFVLFVEIPCRVPVEILPAAVFGARDLGSSSGFANFKDEAELGHGTGNNHHGVDGCGPEQRSSSLVGAATADSGLGVVLAGVVFGRNGMESEVKDWIGRQRRPLGRAAGTTNRNVVEAKVMFQDRLVRRVLLGEGRYGE
jgi:hypothetical protein